MHKILERVKSLVLKTRDAWTDIAAEEASISGLFREYVFPMALVPAGAGLLGNWLVGIRIPFAGWYRFPFGGALLQAIMVYVLTVFSIWIVGMIINWIAPRFGSEQEDIQGMKVAVFISLPFLAASVLSLIPALNPLVFLAGIFCLYIGYVGLPIVMEPSKDKTMTFILISVIALVLVTAMVYSITSAVLHPFGPDIPPLR